MHTGNLRQSFTPRENGLVRSRVDHYICTLHSKGRGNVGVRVTSLTVVLVWLAFPAGAGAQAPSDAGTTPATSTDTSSPSSDVAPGATKPRDDDKRNPRLVDVKEYENTENGSDGPLGPLRLGPMIGTGLPAILNFGALLKITPYFGAGINVGMIPEIRLSYYGEATLAYREYDIFGRVFPFGGGLFVGVGVGYATAKGSFMDRFDTTPYASQVPPGISVPATLTYSSHGSVRTMVLTPQIGYFYTTQIGFSIGVDLGAQIPIAPSRIRYDSQLPLPANMPLPLVQEVDARLLKPSDEQVRTTLEAIGRTPIPTVNLRIGWLI